MKNILKDIAIRIERRKKLCDMETVDSAVEVHESAITELVAVRESLTNELMQSDSALMALVGKVEGKYSNATCVYMAKGMCGIYSDGELLGVGSDLWAAWEEAEKQVKGRLTARKIGKVEIDDNRG